MRKAKSTQEHLTDMLPDYKKGDAINPLVAKKAARELMNIGVLQMHSGQEEFIRIKNKYGRTPKRRLVEAGNKWGKCASVTTLIDTTKGRVLMGDLYCDAKPFEIYSWDGEKKVVTKALPPFKKEGLHQCYRIESSNGQWIEAADKHLVLTSVGYAYVSSLHEVWRSLPVTTSDTYLSVLPSGVVHLSEIQSDYLLSYLSKLRQCGVPLHSVKDNDQVYSPLQAYALQHNETFPLDKDDFLPKQDDNRVYPLRCLLSILDDLLRYAGRFAESLAREFYRLFLQLQYEPQLFQQPCFAEGNPFLLTNESFQYLPVSGNVSSSSVPPLELGNKIISFVPIACQEVYDFEVPSYHNYYAGGLINHNSKGAGFPEDVAHAMGFRPWLSEDDPDFKINIKIPNEGLIGCETMLESVPGIVEPALRALIPPHCQPEWKNNQQGVLKSVTIAYDFFGKKCGSTIHIRSYNQLATTFEGIDYDWEHWDEPPPEDCLKAAERGKISTNAPSWFTMTPLKEAYIRDMFSLKAFNTGGEDQEIAVFRGSTWDNCQDYCKKCGVDIPENHPENMASDMFERPVNRCPACSKILGWVSKAGIIEYFKLFTDPEERAAREDGVWKHLSGLVYKELDYDVHRYTDHEIPKDWMKVECVDPHDARPTRWLFGAVSPEEIIINGKPANRVYWFTYLLANGNIEEIARKVKIKRAEHDYKEASLVILDAKFGAKSIKTMTDETTWEEELIKAGINNIILSHSDPGNIALGHKRVKEYLKPHFSALKGIEIPGMFFAEEGCKGDRSPWQDMSNYQWKEGTDRPEEAYKDFSDCVRYFALEQPTYKPPEKELDMKLARILLETTNPDEVAYNPLTWGLRTA